MNNIVSLDGFYSDVTGNPLALQMDTVFDRANLESIEFADAVLLGRESFDGFSSYWPFVADAPPPEDLLAPEARAFDDTNRAISRRYNAIPKIVVSDRGPISDDNVWFQSTTVIARNEVSQWLTDHPETKVIVFGSHLLWNDLLAHGQVDELHLMISPTVLASGTPAFTRPVELDLIEARAFDDSANVQLRYKPRPHTVPETTSEQSAHESTDNAL